MLVDEVGGDGAALGQLESAVYQHRERLLGVQLKGSGTSESL